MSKKIQILFLILCCISMFSCKKSDTDDTTIKPVMVIMKDHIEYWESVMSGVDRASVEYNAACDVRWSSADGDYESQIAFITEYKSHISKYSGLVIAPINNTVCDYLAENLNQDLKPLVVMDSPAPEGSPLRYNVYIGTNNYQAGVDLANIALEDFPDILSKEVYIFKLSDGNSMEERANGIKSVITNATIVSISENEEEAIPEIINIASSADVIFGANLPTTTYLAKSVYEQSIPTMSVYGFDESEYILARIADETMKGTMVQKSEEMGYLSVKNIIFPTSGKNNENHYLSTEYVTKD